MKETYSLLAIVMPQLYLDFSSSCSVHWCRPTRGSVEKKQGKKSRKLDKQRFRHEGEETFNNNF